MVWGFPAPDTISATVDGVGFPEEPQIMRTSLPAPLIRYMYVCQNLLKFGRLFCRTRSYLSYLIS